MTRRMLAGFLTRLQRARGADAESGNIMFLFLVIIVSTAFGGIMTATVVSQSRTSHFTQTRVQAIDTAQAGIDAVLSRFRTATSTADLTVGDSGRLPGCANPVTGSVGGAQYSVTIAYYSVDPSTLGSDALTKPINNGGQKLLCTETAGPYNSTTGIRTPRYALLTSTATVTGGAATTTGRTIQTTYNFQVLDQNFSGGQIRLYPASSTQTTQFCMDAGANPAVGTQVVLQACDTSRPPTVQQVWEYRADLSIELVSSTSNPKIAGLCIDTGASPTAHAAGDNMVLERCSVADANVCNPADAAANGATCTTSPWNQQWSIDDNAHLEGSKTDQSDIDGKCINAGSQAPTASPRTAAGAGTGLTLQACSGGTADPWQTWIPSPSAGAGSAGASNNQLVNFRDFATCLDVTGQQVNATFLILYSCKQDPNPAKVAFNQKFIPSPALSSDKTKPDQGPVNVLLTVVQGGVTYCLKSPGATAYANNPATAYPVLVRQQTGGCPASVSAAPSGSGFVWTMSQRYTDSTDSKSLAYANRYTIKDADTTASATPLCLGIGVPNTNTPQYNTAVSTRCDGTTGQKWNAVASLAGGSLTNTNELAPSTSGN